MSLDLKLEVDENIKNGTKNDDASEKSRRIFLPELLWHNLIVLRMIRKYVYSILVRITFIIVPSFQIYFLSCIYNSKFYLILYAYTAILVLDNIWVFWKRGGRDYYWFSISFATYITVMVIIIIHQIDYKYYQDDVLCETNRTVLSQLPGCASVNLSMTICTSVDVLVVGFMISLVVARWLLPLAKRMEKEAIYSQVASLTTLSADAIEIAQYMHREEVIESYTLARTCQAIFVLSLVQFCFSIGAVKQRNMRLTGWRRLIDIVFATESWALALALFTQEMPCFILRMILVNVVSKPEFGFYFFAIKNGLMIILLTYRIITLCWRKHLSEKNEIPIKF